MDYNSCGRRTFKLHIFLLVLIQAKTKNGRFPVRFFCFILYYLQVILAVLYKNIFFA